MEDTYVIYKFTFSDGKIYIGQTSKSVTERWQNGEGYKNQDVYVPIILDGWDNIKKEILHTNLTQEQADKLEQYYIKKFDTIKNGYNRSMGKTSSPRIKYIEIDIDETNFQTFLQKNIYKIKPSSVILLLYFYWHKGQTIYFSPAMIEQETNISTKTISRCLKELIEQDIIKKTLEIDRYSLHIN